MGVISIDAIAQVGAYGGISAVVLSSLYLVGITIYNLYFHPLAKYPGPFLGKISSFWPVYGLHKGRWPMIVKGEDILKPPDTNDRTACVLLVYLQWLIILQRCLPTKRTVLSSNRSSMSVPKTQTTSRQRKMPCQQAIFALASSLGQWQPLG